MAVEQIAADSAVVESAAVEQTVAESATVEQASAVDWQIEWDPMPQRR